MPPSVRPAPLNPEPSYPVWKAAAAKALQKLHERAARVTRDGFWTRCYVRNLSPEKAAELAARVRRHAPARLDQVAAVSDGHDEISVNSLLQRLVAESAFGLYRHYVIANAL